MRLGLFAAPSSSGRPEGAAAHHPHELVHHGLLLVVHVLWGSGAPMGSNGVQWGKMGKRNAIVNQLLGHSYGKLVEMIGLKAP